MGFDNDCILNIQSLAGEYFCPVCRFLVYPNEALQSPCNHLYCKPCLTYVATSTQACPYDGYRVTEADSKPLLESNKALADTIGNIQVHCLYYRTGCTWQGSLSDCTSHCATCKFGDSAVLCNRCSIQIVHRQVQEHAQNCPGEQAQAQQPGGVHHNTSAGAGATSEQTQTAAQNGTPASEAPKSQASAPVVSSQAANPTANPVPQPQAAQAAMPTAEQWYQQQQQYQQQYQQYYQQYPGYDPYQQNYQYYYQYPQAVQQYQQQPAQAYPPQAYGQAQPQVYGQTQTQPQPQAQPQLQAQQQVQPHTQPQPHQQLQVPSQGAQPTLQPPVQPAVNAQPQVQPAVNAQPLVPSAGQAQSQAPAQGQAPPSHAFPYNQSQPYAQQQPVPQQQMQVPQYPQTHPQMHHPHAQPYPQPQTQHYPHQQPQVQPQPHSQPNLQASAYPPAQQPVHPSAQLQTPNAVTGFQSYPQPQLHSQPQAGVAQQIQATGTQQQAQYSSQMQGQFPAQAAHMRPPQSFSNVPNQQGQPLSGPSSQQLPVYPHAQQPGYPFQQRPGVQAAQQVAPQQYAQQQSFSGQGPMMQPQASMTSHLHAQGQAQVPQAQLNHAPAHGAQPNVAQNYSARPMAQLTGGQAYAQAPGLAGMGQVRPSQPNQTYPMRTNNQLPVLSGGEKPRDQMLEKGLHDKDDPTKEAGASGAGNRDDHTKLNSHNGLDGSAGRNDSKSDLARSKHVPDTETKLVDNGVQDGKPRTKGDAAEGVSEPLPGGSSAKSGGDDSKDARKKAEVQDLRHSTKGPGGASGPASLLPQVHGANSFPYPPSAQQRPGAPSQSLTHPATSQKSALLGHHPNQLRPQGPGQAATGLPFGATDNSQPPMLKHPPGGITHENPSVGILGPGSSAPFGRPGNVGYHHGSIPHLAGQPQNSQGDPFVGPSVGGQRIGAFDSRGGPAGRDAMLRPDGEQRPPYPMDIEKFQSQRSAYFDGRLPDLHPHGPVPPGGQPGPMKFSGDERIKPFSEEHFKRFPHEDDLRKFPRPSHLEAGPSSNFGTQFPSSGPLDHGPHMFGGDGMSRPFDKGPPGSDCDPAFKIGAAASSGPSRFMPPFHPNDVGERARAFPEDDMGRADFGRRPDFSGQAPGPGFGNRHMDGLPPRSPGRDHPGFPSRTFGPYRDVDGNGPRSFEGSKPHNFRAEPFGKPIHESRFPVPPRGDLDIPGNLRVGEHLLGGPNNHDMLPGHLRRGEHMGPRNLHLGEAAEFGPRGGLSRMGEPPLAGGFPQHIPFGDSFGGDKPGHPLLGEPGFRGGYGFQRYAHDGGFYPGEMEPFDNPRKWKAGSIMCRICKVECGVEGLDLHSQSREHQRKARDMVLSIKQQNKKQKVSRDQASGEERRDGGRPKNSSFQGRGNKR